MTSDIIDPSELTSYAGAGDEGTFAVWTFYNNVDVDKLAKQALRETDAAKRTEIYLKMQQQIHADAPYPVALLVAGPHGGGQECARVQGSAHGELLARGRLEVLT